MKALKNIVNGSRAGFTIVELLIVISIIAVLSGLFGLAFNGVKDRSRMANCISNLRQIGFGLKMYSDDNRLYPPLFLRDSNGVILKKYQWALGGQTGSRFGQPGFHLVPEAKERPLFPYVGKFDLFRCKEDQGIATDEQPLTPSCFAAIGSSYMYNAFFADSDAKTPVEMIPQPHLYITAYEPPATPAGGRNGLLWYFQWHLRKGPPTMNDKSGDFNRYRAVSPVLFLDGHVQKHDFTRYIVGGANPTARTKDWVWMIEKQ